MYGIFWGWFFAIGCMIYGVFHKWGYPSIIHLNGIFPYKPFIWDTPIYGKIGKKRPCDISVKQQNPGLYLRSAPFACIGIVAAASAAAHYGNATEAIGRATISRWRALGLLNGILTYCTARPWLRFCLMLLGSS